MIPYALQPGRVLHFGSPISPTDSDLAMLPSLVGLDRYYRITEQLSAGGSTLAYKARACDSQGIDLQSPDLVLKIPNIDTTGRFTRREQRSRATSIDGKTMDEWRTTRIRLRNCRHANQIIDLDGVWLGDQNVLATVQPFLVDYVPLNHYLQMIGQLDPALPVSWVGVHSAKTWKSLCLAVAFAIDSVHSFRVIHGDIWPPNVFIKAPIGEDGKPLGTIDCKLIDFGESAPFFPSGGHLAQRDHPYRAPEREDSLFAPSEQIDVYSFGKLAMYLACGGPPAIPRECRDLSRRNFVVGEIEKRNRRLLIECPEAADVITRCVAFDPVSRPSMVDVVAQLSRESRTGLATIAQRRSITKQVLGVLKRYRDSFHEKSLFLNVLLDQRLSEIQSLFSDVDNEMMRVDGSRDQMIRCLESLFQQLSPGDSWTAITSYSVWQASALGLHGRYMTATIRAVRRGVSVHRTYLVSVEELGVAWARRFCAHLRIALGKAGIGAPTVESINRVVAAVDVAIIHYENELRLPSTTSPVGGTPSSGPMCENAARFADVLTMLSRTFELWELGQYLWRGEYAGVEHTTGLYFGLAIMSTRRHCKELRLTNPASIVRHGRDPGEWMLVVIDIRGRSTDFGSDAPPTLKGVRIYPSASQEDGVPTERISEMERAYRHRSINIGAALSILADAAQAANCENPDVVPDPIA